MKTVAIIQSNYIPWKGYFDIIASADEFIVYDDMQYTKRDWRNRNIIKTPNGPQWLTVPVISKGRFVQSIRETEIDGDNWRTQHWKSLSLNYKKSKYFPEIQELIQETYSSHHSKISELNIKLIKTICQYLQIETRISNSSEYRAQGDRTDRLVDLCVQSGATEYISGPSAKNYINPEQFTKSGINLRWFEYSDYPEYPQLWGGFTHHVSILDLLFNCGQESANYMLFQKK
jgi:hypothetical protein